MKRQLMAVALATAALISLPTPAQARPNAIVPFDLNAVVLDGGEQVTAVTLDTSRLGRVDAAGLTTQTFSVHAKAESPVQIENGEVIYSLYDTDREVTGVRVEDGDIVVELKHGPGVSGAATLGYLGVAARNVMLDLSYTIAQNSAITVNGRPLTLSGLVQRDLVDPEVDAFAHHTSAEGIKYRLFEPRRTGSAARTAAPLIIWLHGNGEGGIPASYNNESQLRANRGGVGPATPEAQAIFGGAYVLAPQVPDTWYNIDSASYDTLIKAVIDQVVRRNRIDPERIYLLGGSAGGMMTLQLAGRYPSFFAADVTTAPALYLNRTGLYTTTAEQLLTLQTTPTWLVHATNDPVVPYDKSSLWAYTLLQPFGNVTLTTYDGVVWDGVTYSGHASWIYTARNDPANADGEHVWQWLARQHR
ncbi:MAG: prolyl oligopeptidase family serine peptidase [Micropruina sp.]|nr:prolyl oligopeptidase family serine peptidase [Micropruina sp.]